VNDETSICKNRGFLQFSSATPYVQLLKKLRNLFAHGDPQSFDPTDKFQSEAAPLFEKLFPGIPKFGLDIDKVLEPLKDQVLDFIKNET